MATEETMVFSKRARRVAIWTGVVSAVALLPIFFLLYPALLIVGGIIQPRFPMIGRVLSWIGVAALWTVFVSYDVHVLLPDPSGAPVYMMLSFLASEVLLAWCSMELIRDAVSEVRSWGPRRVDRPENTSQLSKPV